MKKIRPELEKYENLYKIINNISILLVSNKRIPNSARHKPVRIALRSVMISYWISFQPIYKNARYPQSSYYLAKVSIR